MRSFTAIMADPDCSHWLRCALAGAIDRDPIDAAADGELLAKLLSERADAVLAAGDPKEWLANAGQKIADVILMFRDRENGGTSIEYALIAAMVGVALMASFSAIGSALGNLWVQNATVVDAVYQTIN
jgi:Flp pilus assembly pilin Flp